MPSPIRWHGGKGPLASKIVALMPSHIHYVEPFFGAGSVLFKKNPEGVSEVVNDIDGDLMNFWTVLQHPDLFPQFVRACEATPVSEVSWARALDGLGVYTDSVGRAWAFFVLVRQSLGGRIAQPNFTGITRRRLRREMNAEASAWLTAVEGLPEVHARLKRVVIFNRDAAVIIRQQDGPDTLFYLDPPYLADTRESPTVYRHEMTRSDHERLLAHIKRCQGKVMLSGYPHPLYSAALADWPTVSFDVANHAAGAGRAKGRETEVIWCNFQPRTEA